VTRADGGFAGRMRVRVEQFAPALGDVDVNLGRIAAAAADAGNDEVDLLLTPELSLTGYDLRDLVHEVARPVTAGFLSALAGGPDVVLGMVERGDDFVPYNTAVHLRAGEALHAHRKVYLPTYGMFDEGRYFGRGDRARVYDAGGGWRAGILVCEDLWHPSLAYLLALGGANLLMVQCAAAGRGAWDGRPGGRFASWSAWEHLACAAAVSYGIYVVLANRVGVEGSVVFGGGSMIVDPAGTVVSRGDDLAEDRITAELDLTAVSAARRPFAHARDEDPHLVARELRRLAAARS
jgi:N-carbamoylputrescine amidase